ncbi:transketolase [Candidatus Peregrinibacteria bacterium CG_4_10_14_0_2_um_filter_38_24]|nr:MAG: transketolase [Candidatus Peregrinibacteria bacterium CG_4_10_14_0_2_um_filter_38_24]PJC39302.1 MAG: transketolase [Candidatus Peregrinibacteria bacterium CG_4_9_14_0_2_um_filter_38_9]
MKYPIPFDERELKLKTIQMRKDILLATHSAGSGHPGGSLSATEILTVLYNCILRHEPSEPENEDRDRFILSKAHITPGYYSILARTGYIDPAEIPNFRKFGSFLQGHPKKDLKHGIEIGGGSLGQNFSVACGLALGLKQRNKTAMVYDLSSEGELQEGSMWEAIMAAPHFKLNNLCMIVDYNNLQIDGCASDIMGVAPLDKKFEAFNWNVIVVKNGHNLKEVYDAFKKVEELSKTTEKPTVIIATTIKGYGVSYMANVCGWHGKAPNKEEYDKGIQELDDQINQLNNQQ